MAKVNLQDLVNNPPSWAQSLREDYSRKKSAQENKAMAVEAEAQKTIADAQKNLGRSLSDEEQVEVYNALNEGRTFDLSNQPKADFSNVQSRVVTKPEEKTYWERVVDGVKNDVNEFSTLANTARAGAYTTGAGLIDRLAAQLDSGLDETTLANVKDQAAKVGVQLPSDSLRNVSNRLRTEADKQTPATQKLAETLKNRGGLEEFIGGGLLDAASTPTQVLSVVGGPTGLAAVADAYARAYHDGAQQGLKGGELEAYAVSQGAPELVSVIPAGKAIEKIPLIGPLVKKRVTELGEGLVRKMTNPGIAAAVATAKTAMGESLEETASGSMQDLALAAFAGQEKSKELADVAKASEVVNDDGSVNWEQFGENRYRDFRAAAVSGGALGAIGSAGKVAEYNKAKTEEANTTTEAVLANEGARRQEGTDRLDAELTAALAPRMRERVEQDARAATIEQTNKAYDAAEAEAVSQRALEEEAGFQTLERDRNLGTRVDRFADTMERVPLSPAAEITPEQVRAQQAPEESPEAIDAAVATPTTNTPNVSNVEAPAAPEGDMPAANEEDAPSTDDLRARLDSLRRGETLQMAGRAKLTLKPKTKNSPEQDVPSWVPADRTPAQQEAYAKKVKESVTALARANTHQTADVQNLLRQGKIVMTDRPDSVGRKDLGSQAEYDTKEGRMYLYMDNLETKDVPSTVMAALHEATHAGQFNNREDRPDIYTHIMGKEGVASANNQIRRAANNGNKLAQKAVSKAVSSSPNKQVQDIELMPYFVSEAVAARNTTLGQLGGVVRDLKASANKFGRESLGRNIPFSLADIDSAAQRVGDEVVKTNLNARDRGLTLQMVYDVNDSTSKDNIARSYQSVDGKRKYVLSDKDAKIKPEKLYEILTSGEPSSTVKLGELMDHNVLYKEVPEARDIPIRIVPDKELPQGAFGMYDPADQSIYIGKKVAEGARETKIRPALMHEIQHYVQDQNGRSRQFYDINSTKISPKLAKAEKDLAVANDRINTAARNFLDNVRYMTENATPSQKKDVSTAVFNRNLSVPEKASRVRDILGNSIPDNRRSFLNSYEAARKAYNALLPSYNAMAIKENAGPYLANITEREAFYSQYNVDTPQEVLDSEGNPEEAMRIQDADLDGYDPTDGRIDVPQENGTVRPMSTDWVIDEVEDFSPVDSAEFKQWFGNSTIKNRDGTPKKMYHGTQKAFDTFRPNELGLIFVSPSEQFAEAFAGMDAFTWDQNKALPLYVRAENPWDYNNSTHVSQLMGDETAAESLRNKYAAIFSGFSDSPMDTSDVVNSISAGEWELLEIPEAISAIKNLGYDSMYVYEAGDKNLAVFDPNQLKHATKNNGEFSRTDNSIFRMASPTPVSVPRSKFNPREMLNRALAHGQREQLADIKVAEDLDTQLQDALKKDTGSRRMSQSLSDEINSILTSGDNNTATGRAAIYNKLTNKLPNVAPIIMEVRDRITRQTLDTVQHMLDSGRDLSVAERKSIETMLANVNTYMTRGYAAYEKDLGRGWSKTRFKNYSTNIGNTLDSITSPKVLADVKAVRDGIEFLRKDLTIPEDSVLLELPMEKLVNYYERWNGNIDRLPGYNPGRKNVEDNRAIITNALADFRQSLTETELNKAAEDGVKALLGLGSTGQKYVTQINNMAKDPGTLKERKFVPLEIRKLLGEIDYAPGAMLETLSRQAALKSRAMVFSEILRENQGTLVMSPKELRSAEGKDNWVLAEGPSWGVLEGYYVDPKLYARMNNALSTFNTWGEAFSMLTTDGWKPLGTKLWDTMPRVTGRLNRLSKVSTVIFNGSLWAGNLIGSPLTLIGNGNFLGTGTGRGVITSADYVAGTLKNTSSPKLEDAIRYLNMEAADIGELQNVLGNKMKQYLDGSLDPNEAYGVLRNHMQKATEAGGRGFRTLTAAYAVLDNWAKVANFYHRFDTLKAMYSSAGDTRSEVDIAREAGDDVSLTNFSPERAPAWLRSFEARGLSQYGPYFYEVIRTRFTGYQLAYKDIQRGNELKQAGNTKAASIMYRAAATRLIGHTFVNAAVPAVGSSVIGGLLAGAGIMVPLGGEDEDKELKRLLLSEFNRDQDLITIGYNKDGLPIYLPVSQRFDPNGPYTDIHRMIVYSETDEALAKNLAGYAVNDLFVKPQWLKDIAAAVFDKTASQSVTGELLPALKEVGESATGSSNTTERALNLVDAFLPGMVRAWVTRNTAKGMTEGSSVTKAFEGAGVSAKQLADGLNAMGFKYETFDPGPVLADMAGASRDMKKENSGQLNRDLALSGGLTKEQVKEAVINYRVRELTRSQKDYAAVKAMRAWKISDDITASQLLAKGFSRDEIPLLMAGEAQPVIQLKSVVGYMKSSTRFLEDRTAKERNQKGKTAIAMLIEMEPELNAMGIILDKKGLTGEYK